MGTMFSTVLCFIMLSVRKCECKSARMHMQKLLMRLTVLRSNCHTLHYSPRWLGSNPVPCSPLRRRRRRYRSLARRERRAWVHRSVDWPLTSLARDPVAADVALVRLRGTSALGVRRKAARFAIAPCPPLIGAR